MNKQRAITLVVMLTIIIIVQFAAILVIADDNQPTHQWECKQFGDTGQPVCDYWIILPDAQWQNEHNVRCDHFEDGSYACRTEAEWDYYRNN